jgi:hypothetical protein
VQADQRADRPLSVLRLRIIDPPTLEAVAVLIAELEDQKNVLHPPEERSR